MYLLKKGDKGKKVKELQTMLNIINKTFINITGDYGNKTLSCCCFQKKYKLKPDGIVGNMTYAKLLEVSRSKLNKGKASFD